MNKAFLVKNRERIDRWIVIVLSLIGVTLLELKYTAMASWVFALIFLAAIGMFTGIFLTEKDYTEVTQ